VVVFATLAGVVGAYLVEHKGGEKLATENGQSQVDGT